MEKINQFRDERNWRPFHNEKDLALFERRTRGCFDLLVYDGRQPGF